ncbi:hypothetical protein EV122DRAFT_282013 [Schizophyllum commune]
MIGTALAARRPDDTSVPLRLDQIDAGNRSRREDDSRESPRPLPTIPPPLLFPRATATRSQKRDFVAGHPDLAAPY